MERKWAIRLGMGGWIVLVYGIYYIQYTYVPDLVPRTIGMLAMFGLTAAGLVAIGNWDKRRWRRMLRSLEFRPVTDETRIDGLSRTAFYGRFRGRDVYVDYQGAIGSRRNDDSLVVARHDAPITEPLIVQRLGAGGTGGGDLPPTVEFPDADFSTDFRAYAADPAFADAVLTREVRRAILDVPDVKELVLEPGRVTAEHMVQLPTEPVIRSLATAVCRVAEAAEAATDT